MTNNKFAFILAMLACVCFAACDNPIMKEWWAEKENETGSAAKPGRGSGIIEIINAIKDIRVLYINYIIFAPDSIYYNAPSHAGGTDLTTQRKDLNNTIVHEVKHIVDAIDTTQSKIKILVNGYSNPAVPPTDPRWDDEVIDCQWVSNARAEEVTGELIFIGVDSSLITYDGYGGTQTIVMYNPDNLASAELNRRVEIIVVEVVQ